MMTFQELVQWSLPRFTKLELDFQNQLLSVIKRLPTFRDQKIVTVVETQVDESYRSDDAVWLKLNCAAYFPNVPDEEIAKELVSVVKEEIGSQGGSSASEVKFENGILRCAVFMPWVELPPEKQVEEEAPEEEDATETEEAPKEEDLADEPAETPKEEKIEEVPDEI